MKTKLPTTDKQFLFIDKSGRGIKYKLPGSHLIANWDLSEIDYDNDTPLQDFINNSEVGEEWNTTTIKLIAL